MGATRPPAAHSTFVDEDEVQSPNPGYCFLCAGFERLRQRTKDRNLVILRLAPEKHPAVGARDRDAGGAGRLMALIMATRKPAGASDWDVETEPVAVELGPAGELVLTLDDGEEITVDRQALHEAAEAAEGRAVEWSAA
ncbi:MAG: hypothetical protein M3340_02115 [Actinomycetota bacterium]|nr:hypothetical protein [Actinomycetota bacterium]